LRRFDTGSMNANKLVRQLRREAMANPKKAAVLGLLLLAGAYYWGPLLWSWTASGRASGEPAGEKSIASTATAPAALAQTSTTEPDALLSDKNPSHPWSQLDEWIRQDPATSPANDLAGWRNPFAVAPSTQAATDAREQAQPERTQVTPESLGIELSGTAVGPLRRVAMIGGTASGDDLTLRATSHATDGDIVFQSDGTPTETMRITSAGLVGIGTTSPDILLHVNGAAQVGDPSTTTGSLAFYHASNAFASTFTASASASSSASYTLPVDDGTSGQLLTTDGVGVLTWSSVAAASGWTDGGTFVYLTTLSDNVGIGTASIDADISGVLGNVKLNIASNATMNYHQSWIGNSANTEGAVIASLKTRSDGTDADSIVLNGDSVGRWEGYAADGAAYQRLAAIEMEVDGVPGNVDMPGRIVFSTTPDGSGSLGMLERWRITQAGNLFSATASRVVVGSANDDFDGDVTGTLGGVKLGALSSGISNYHAALVGNGANTSPAFLAGMKTRGVGSDANTVVVSGDGLFQIEAYGADGASYQRAAAIQFASDGTPGTSDMPGRIVFSTTPDGSGGAAMAERMRITNAGNVGIGATGPDRLLDVLDSANPQMRLTQTDGVNYTDLQTGSAGNLAITASGGNITTTGNVGIGSTLPGRQLDVFHASNPQIRVSNTAAIYAEAQETGAGNLVFTLTGGTGNVGIGSAVPAKKLSITGAVEYSTDNGLNPIGQTDAAGANGGTLTNSPTTGDPAFWLRVTINGTNYAIPAWTVP